MITCEELLSPLSPAGSVLSDHHNVRIVVKFANHLGEAALGHSYLDRLTHNLALPHGIDKLVEKSGEFDTAPYTDHVLGLRPRPSDLSTAEFAIAGRGGDEAAPKS